MTCLTNSALSLSLCSPYYLLKEDQVPRPFLLQVCAPGGASIKKGCGWEEKQEDEGFFQILCLGEVALTVDGNLERVVIFLSPLSLS